MAPLKVLVSDKISETGVAILKNAGLTVDVKTGLPEDEIVNIIGDYHGMVVRSETKVTKKIIDAAKNLKIIGRAGVGVDNIDVEASTNKGIIVVNSPEGNTIAAAEQTVALMFACARKTAQAVMTMRNGGWDRNKFKGVELKGKTLGIIGFGKIGQHVARCCVGIGMKVLAADPFANHDMAKQIGAEIVDQEKIYKEADFITLHVPKTKDTANMINKDVIAKMKKGVYIINCARGGIIDEADLISACESGQVAGAAIDVFEKEPAEGHPFTKVANIITTPHLGASTTEAQENVALDVAQQIAEVLNGGEAASPVNIPALKPQWIAQVKEFMVLAEKVGVCGGQIIESAIKEINISYYGSLVNKEIAPLTVALLKGLFSAMGSFEQVNFVNAPIIAKNMSLKISETKVDTAIEVSNQIVLSIKTEQGKHEVAGTRYEKIGERIISIEGLKVDLEPQGYVLLAPNKDQPGVIGSLGTMLGKNKINIASMTVARDKVGGNAIMIIKIDELVSDKILKDVESLDAIRGKVKQIKF